MLLLNILLDCGFVVGVNFVEEEIKGVRIKEGRKLFVLRCCCG